MGVVFEYSFSLAEYVAKIKASLPEDYRPQLSELETMLDLRDSELEDFLDLDSVATSLGVQRAANQSIANATSVPLSFDVEEYTTTTAATWDVSPNPTRITFNTAGVYLVTGSLRFAANATGTREAVITLNGVTDLTGDTGPGNASVVTFLSCARLYPFASDDYIELYAQQNAGGALNATGSLQVIYQGSTT